MSCSAQCASRKISLAASPRPGIVDRMAFSAPVDPGSANDTPVRDPSCREIPASGEGNALEESVGPIRSVSTTAWLNRVGTAVPALDIHQPFVSWGATLLNGRGAKLFERMAKRSGIAHRWSVLRPGTDGSPLGPGGFYEGGRMPSTSERMALYAAEAPSLAIRAIEDMGPLPEITHLVVASCTGFVAPGVDQIIASRLGLRQDLERTLIGFMGCYAAVAALRTARHIVRSDPTARVLVVTIELCTLHLQATTNLEELLAMLLFGDGAAAGLVTAEPAGIAIEAPFSMTLPDTSQLIRWTIGDQGFSMHLSGEVPQRLGGILRDTEVRARFAGDAWAVHGGGRSILDAVDTALELPPASLSASRTVLAEYGNLSSSTLLFVLNEFMDAPNIRDGVAVAFGPGLAAEGFRFRNSG